MSKAYFVIFGILLAIPVIIAALAVIYFCFKLSMLAGAISIVVCVVVIVVAYVTVHFKIKSIERGNK
ncbi:MAG: hypothetical protein J1F36_04630 [Clostridiales bacterium]|nr:hypothetical protein [Clostridiales bacterium]